MPSTFTVTNTNPSGAGSLSQAIIDANNNPGADTIKFKHVEGIITISSELSVTDDVTVKGPGADKLTVSGGGTTRVFNFAAGTTDTLKALTIANGFVNGEDGAGILNMGTLTVQDSVVSGNTSFQGSAYGAGIWSGGSSAALTVKNSKVSSNYGGGIYASGIATLQDSTISDN